MKKTQRTKLLGGLASLLLGAGLTVADETKKNDEQPQGGERKGPAHGQRRRASQAAPAASTRPAKSTPSLRVRRQPMACGALAT